MLRSLLTGRKNLIIKYDIESIKEYFSKFGYQLLDNEYKGVKWKYKYICPEGHKEEISFDKFKNADRRCKVCSTLKKSKDRKLSYEQVKRSFTHLGFTLLESDYLKSSIKMKCRCTRNHITFISLNNLKRGKGCKYCYLEDKSDIHRKYDFEMVKEIFRRRGYELLSKQYTGCFQKLNYICPMGHIGAITLGRFNYGNGCQKCGWVENGKKRRGVPVYSMRGERHPNWNFSKSDLERENRRGVPGYKVWRSEVYERDCYTCQCCGNNKGGDLNAHHLDGYDWCKEKRTDVDNGITLCKKCHKDFHGKYGYGSNTRMQFEEYIINLSDNGHIEQQNTYSNKTVVL